MGTKDVIEKIKKLAPTPNRAHTRHQRQELRPSIAQILQTVAKAYGLAKTSLEKGIRGQENEARKVAMWLCKEKGDLSHSQIAKAFYVKSPDTVGWSCRQIDKQKVTNKKLDKKLKNLAKTLMKQ